MSKVLVLTKNGEVIGAYVDDESITIDVIDTEPSTTKGTVIGADDNSDIQYYKFKEIKPDFLSGGYSEMLAKFNLDKRRIELTRSRWIDAVTDEGFSGSFTDFVNGLMDMDNLPF